MRALIALCLALGLSSLSRPALAQSEADLLRRELEQLKQQFETTRQQYQRTLQDLSERLQRLEAQPSSRAGPGALSTLDLARPREPFALFERRGSGQFLFDLGITGDFAGSVTSKRVEQARVGSLSGEENRIFPREIEVSFFGQIDPYARAEVRVEAGDELEDDGSRAFGVELAEANFTLLAIPWGFQPKLGRMRTRFGYLNEFHQHDRPFIDTPNVYLRFFGDEGLVENGAELAWVAPTPVYLQAIVGVLDGDNDVAFGAGTLRDPLVTGRLRTFVELADTLGLQVGLSGATGVTTDDQRASYLGLDAKVKYTPEGWKHPLLSGGGELLFARRKNLLATSGSDGALNTTLRPVRLGQETQELETREAYGLYIWAQVQPWRRWALGLRYDWTEDPATSGHEWAIGPYLTSSTTEFLRFRLGYKHTERSGFGSPDILDELLFQATFILGAHPADLF